MDDILDTLEQTGTGLLISVDELDSRLDEMIQLAAVYQHFVREGRRVALLMADLPNEVSSILNDKTVSFLRRAQIKQSVAMSRCSNDRVIHSAPKGTWEQSLRPILSAESPKQQAGRLEDRRGRASCNLRPHAQQNYASRKNAS